VTIIAATGVAGWVLLIGAGVAGLAFGTYLSRVLGRRGKK